MSVAASRAGYAGRIPTDGLADLCQRWHIQNLYLFGSILRDDFAPGSDVDVVVSFVADHVPGLTFVDLCEELSCLFGRPVDVFVREDIEQSRDTTARRAILGSMTRIYGNDWEYDVSEGTDQPGSAGSGDDKPAEKESGAVIIATERDVLTVGQIVDACKSIERFCKDRTFDDFANDDMLSSAVERKITIIGEAASPNAKRLNDAFKDMHPEVP